MANLYSQMNQYGGYGALPGQSAATPAVSPFKSWNDATGAGAGLQGKYAAMNNGGTLGPGMPMQDGAGSGLTTPQQYGPTVPTATGPGGTGLTPTTTGQGQLGPGTKMADGAGSAYSAPSTPPVSTGAAGQMTPASTSAAPAPSSPPPAQPPSASPPPQQYPSGTFPQFTATTTMGDLNAPGAWTNGYNPQTTYSMLNGGGQASPSAAPTSGQAPAAPTGAPPAPGDPGWSAYAASIGGSAPSSVTPPWQLDAQNAAARAGAQAAGPDTLNLGDPAWAKNGGLGNPQTAAGYGPGDPRNGYSPVYNTDAQRFATMDSATLQHYALARMPDGSIVSNASGTPDPRQVVVPAPAGGAQYPPGTFQPLPLGPTLRM